MNEAERLEALLAACEDVLSQLEGREDEIAMQVRRTCASIQKRLEELHSNPELAAD